MVAAIGLNSLASLTAVALWALAPCRGVAQRCAPTTAAPLVGEPATHASRGGFARGLVPRAASEPSGAPEQQGELGAPPSVLNERLRRSAPAPAGAAGALAARLHMNPQVLADRLGDAKGDLPAPSAERLERAFEAGNALARRLGLDAVHAQSLVTLVTNYAFSVLVEEKKAAPGAADPEQMEAIRVAATDDIRATCGDRAAAEAGEVLTGLR